MSSLFIAGTGVRIPATELVADAVADGRYSAEDHATTGLESVAVSPTEFPPDMAVAAAREALADWGGSASEIAMTLHAGLADQGLFLWHAASYVHRHTVGTDAPAIEVGAMSNGGMVALTLALDHLRGASRSAVMVTTADRFADLPGGLDRWTLDDGLVPGDGATAMIVSRAGGFARVLGHHLVADSSLEGLHRGDASWHASGDRRTIPSYRARKRAFLSGTSLPAVLDRLAAGSRTAVEEALRRGGVTARDVDHWVLPNMGLEELTTYYLGPLGASLQATCWEYGRTIGHLGAGDQVANLTHLRRTGRLTPGQLVVMIGIGSGFSWSCVVLRIEHE